ncbi:MAG: glutamate-5-semialdehyde dehydrogenase [Candidatus Peribacteraceae bacterium]|nr:glutamate-5-semialdehyde dehydrogenase [Candidatus Peribacteraceae bacterium]
MPGLTEQFRAARKASRVLAGLPDSAISDVLLRFADTLEEEMQTILQANERDLLRMDPRDPKYDRLLLNADRIRAIANDVRSVAKLPSPVGKILEERTRPNGLQIAKITVPLGVIGIVYEARPNVTADTFSLCFKSRNVCVLKGGSDASDSNEAVAQCIRHALRASSLPEECVLLLPPDRSAVKEMLHAHEFIDVVIPRGSQNLISFVRGEATIPVIETGAGIVHIYVDASADSAMAASVIHNAKTRRPGVCNAVDTVIIHHDRLVDLPQIAAPLAASGVRIFADKAAFASLRQSYDPALLEHAKPEHFGTEFLSLQLSIVTVKDFDEALAHIVRHSSGHSESIIAKDQGVIDRFLREVDAAAVYANASTAFTDGAQFGLGAEIGISTQKLHARGPMGLEALTSYKWIVRGSGQIRTP